MGIGREHSSNESGGSVRKRKRKRKVRKEVERKSTYSGHLHDISRGYIPCITPHTQTLTRPHTHSLSLSLSLPIYTHINTHNLSLSHTNITHKHTCTQSVTHPHSPVCPPDREPCCTESWRVTDADRGTYCSPPLPVAAWLRRKERDGRD